MRFCVEIILWCINLINVSPCGVHGTSDGEPISALPLQPDDMQIVDVIVNLTRGTLTEALYGGKFAVVTCNENNTFSEWGLYILPFDSFGPLGCLPAQACYTHAHSHTTEAHILSQFSGGRSRKGGIRRPSL